MVVPSGFVNVAVSTESTVTVIWSSIGEVVTILSGKLKAKTISFRWSVAGLSLLGFETGPCNCWIRTSCCHISWITLR